MSCSMFEMSKTRCCVIHVRCCVIWSGCYIGQCFNYCVTGGVGTVSNIVPLMKSEYCVTGTIRTVSSTVSLELT